MRNAVAFEVSDRRSEDMGKAGAYCFMIDHLTGERIGIVHACPCGCGMRSAMWFTGKAINPGHEWEVTGEWPNVTLSPSIGIRGPEGQPFHWHGYLENGVWMER